MVLSFRVGASKNINIDHEVKETCAAMSTQVTYEIDHIYFKCPKFVFYVFYRNLKEKDHIKRNINSKKRNVYIGNQYYYFGFPIIRVSRARTSCLRPMENNGKLFELAP